MNEWRPLYEAPRGLDFDRKPKWFHVLFRGWSASGAFDGPVYVSGWIDTNGEPVHNYRYKLRIDAWTLIPGTELPG